MVDVFLCVWLRERQILVYISGCRHIFKIAVLAELEAELLYLAWG